VRLKQAVLSYEDENRQRKAWRWGDSLTRCAAARQYQASSMNYAKEHPAIQREKAAQIERTLIAADAI
jgi:hypothetical protein